MSEIKETCLHDRHVALGAQMSPFGGFSMPIIYSSIIEEHNAVRKACGVFDVSHMGEVLVTGEQSETFVQHIFTNNVANAPIGKIYYGLMLYPTGGAVDDLLVYKKGEKEFLLVINAANIDKDLDWIYTQAKDYDVTITNQCDYYGQLAVQGPKAEGIVEKYLKLSCKDLKFYTFETLNYKGEEIIVSRTGYTGEDGFEIYASHKVIIEMWDTLLASKEVVPCGLGCRDTLRFEVGLPLYGDELGKDITPIEAGLGFFVKLDKEEFIGKEVCAKQKAEGVTRKLVGIELKSKAIPRHGYDIVADDKKIGTVTTGYRTISTDKSVCLAYVDIAYAKLGTEVKVQIHKKQHEGVVVKKRFFDKNYKK